MRWPVSTHHSLSSRSIIPERDLLNDLALELSTACEASGVFRVSPLPEAETRMVEGA
jgi:hypothetical protein